LKVLKADYQKILAFSCFQNNILLNEWTQNAQ